MFRYVAFVWDDADQAARDGARALSTRLRSGARSWTPALAQNGLAVFCSDVRPGASEPYFLHRDAGVVLGKLFETGSDERSRSVPAELSEQATGKILQSAGRSLVEHYWGRYVAFFQDAERRVTRVLRDPAGGLPCFTTRIQGVDVFFSNMEEGALLGDRPFRVNWTYVAAVLCQSRVQVHETGLDAVSQVLGGECVELSAGRESRQFYWDALRIAESGGIDNAYEAVRLLRERTRDCVHAWAGSYRSIIHMLSGGLDSSIVLACLKDAPGRPHMTCLNFHSPGSNTDERAYARLAAQGAHCEVVEQPRDLAVSLRSLLNIQKSCTPTDYFFYLDGRRAEAEVAAEHHATAVFTGNGGDQVFYQARARFAAGDYLSRRGVRPALFNVALDAARIDRVSVWNVLRDAVVHGLFGRRWNPRNDTGLHRTLIRADVVRDISRDVSLVHPWLRVPGRTPSGKRWHAYQLLFPFDFYNPLGREADPEPVTPLFSQPLLELVLRIPTWLLTIGGWDRALARRAFQHDVPRPIVTRRAKGGQEEHAKAILMRELGFARELLLEGQLVREKIIDGARVSEALSGRPSRTGAGNSELYGCLSAEAWVHQWRIA